MNLPNDISNMLQDECKKLDELIRKTTLKELTIHDIVNTYYQIINVSSILTMLKQQVSNDTLQDVTSAEKKISEFNSKIHPKILSHITAVIEDTRKNLRVNQHTQSQTDMEKMADMYEDLRQKMSTREFVEQYDKKLAND